MKKIMKKKDLHDEFLQTLQQKFDKRSQLINKVSDILSIEKESAYRRISGRVYFTVREMGLITQALNISVDNLLNDDNAYQWIPFSLNSPLKYNQTIDDLYNEIDSRIERIVGMSGESSESGGVYNSIPIEFYIHHPLLTKFLFFKWGHYFVGTEEFDNFSEWELPSKFHTLREKVLRVRFSRLFYIWDSSITWTLVNEIRNFYKMRVISTEEKNALKEELKEQLNQLELYMKGGFIPNEYSYLEVKLYVSTVHIGFSSIYYTSEEKNMVLFQTNFSGALIDDNHESLVRMKEWIKSIRNVSTLISHSGNIERRLFFQEQHRIIDHFLP